MATSMRPTITTISCTSRRSKVPQLMMAFSFLILAVTEGSCDSSRKSRRSLHQDTPLLLKSRDRDDVSSTRLTPAAGVISSDRKSELTTPAASTSLNSESNLASRAKINDDLPPPPAHSKGIVLPVDDADENTAPAAGGGTVAGIDTTMISSSSYDLPVGSSAYGGVLADLMYSNAEYENDLDLNLDIDLPLLLVMEDLDATADVMKMIEVSCRKDRRGENTSILDC